jgi:Putative zinc-finger
MNCRYVEPLLSKRLERRLPDREADAVTTHLRDCPACRGLQADLRRLSSELRELTEVSPPPDVERRVAERWFAERAEVAAPVRSVFCWLSSLRRPDGGRVPAQRVPVRWGVMSVAAIVGVLGFALAGVGIGRWAGARSTPSPMPPTKSSAARFPGSAGGWAGPSPSPASPRGPIRTGRPRSRQFAAKISPDGALGLRLTQRRAPVSAARRRDDLTSLNGNPRLEVRRWMPRSADGWGERGGSARRAARLRDDFVRVPFPRLADTTNRQLVAAVESYQREAAVVDARLTREVTLQQKGTALADLCDRLRGDTGIQLTAGPSVADEKVTVFCRKLPLRDVMRQLSRPFGYTWLRSGKDGDYRYELVQDLRSQLLEEELRNRDRNEALLSLEREIEKYRPYLDLSPDDALARAKTARPVEKKLLENLAGLGWGPIHLYFRLSRDELSELRSRQEIRFAAGELRAVADVKVGDRALPPDLAPGVLQSLRDWRLSRSDSGFGLVFDPKEAPGTPLISAIPEARALATVELRQSELGQFTLGGMSGLYTTGERGIGPGDVINWGSVGALAVGASPTVLRPDNARANARFARDPAFRPRVTVQPPPSCRPVPERDASAGNPPELKVTVGDVLEALHRATGLPVVGDYYTRLYKPATVSVQSTPLFDVLNRLADEIRLRWNRDGDWLQFRSTSFYDDRLKEVPNRLLARWSLARRQHSALSLDELIEIARLPDPQLDAEGMAEGARECWGLKEWDLARNGNLRSHLRYLAGFTPVERQAAMSPAGLPLTRMSLAQQQGFIARFRSPEPLESLEELAGATLRVEYTQPGDFTWRVPGPWVFQWAVPTEPGRQGRRILVPTIHERTRAAALEAARQLATHFTETLLPFIRRRDPQFDAAKLAVQAEQIVPTELDLKIAYIHGTINKHCVVQYSTQGDWGDITW